MHCHSHHIVKIWIHFFLVLSDKCNRIFLIIDAKTFLIKNIALLFKVFIALHP